MLLKLEPDDKSNSTPARGDDAPRRHVHVWLIAQITDRNVRMEIEM